MKKYKLAFAATITVALFSVGVVSAAPPSGGGTPNGRPFVAINGEIVEVKGAISTMQDKINELVLRADTAEGQMVNFQTAITTLNQQNANLLTLINQNTTDISSIYAIIAGLEAQNVALKAQLATTTGDVADLQAQVQAIESEITALQAAINSGFLATQISLADLQNLINTNSSMITAIKQDMQRLDELIASKQDILNGACPSGQALHSITPNGSIGCMSPGESIGGLSLIRVTNYGYDCSPIAISCAVYAQCPEGTILTGGGFNVFESVDSSEPHRNGWMVHGKGFFHNLTRSTAMCLAQP